MKIKYIPFTSIKFEKGHILQSILNLIKHVFNLSILISFDIFKNQTWHDINYNWGEQIPKFEEISPIKSIISL